MRAYERLLEYVKVKTPSSEENMETPSSSCQFELAERLVEEMKELGIEDAAVDGKCYVYGTILATEGYENSPSLGFIAHMDTVSEFTENPIHPVLHENYDGQNLVFDEGGTRDASLSSDEKSTGFRLSLSHILITVPYAIPSMPRSRAVTSVL